MGISKQASGGVSEHLICRAFIAIAAFAYRKVPAATLIALPADDCEWDHDTFADLQSAFTSLPTSTTSPMNSWPITSPLSMPGM